MINKVIATANRSIPLLVSILSAVAIPFYIMGYAYYWGSLDAYSLSLHQYPLQFDDYIAEGFIALIEIMSDIINNLNWAAIFAAISIFIFYASLISIIHNNIKNIKHGKLFYFIRYLINKITNFYKPAKEILLSLFAMIASSIALYVAALIIAVIPALVFFIGKNSALSRIEKFKCNDNPKICAEIKSTHGSYNGWLIAENKYTTSIFTGDRTITMRTNDIISIESFRLKKQKKKTK